MAFAFRHLPTISEADNTANFEQLQAGFANEWSSPLLEHSWVPYGAASSPPAYLRDLLGFVHLRGAIKGGASGSVAFTLPEGYRPKVRVDTAIVQNGAAAGAYLQITAAGEVVPVGGEVNLYASLDVAPFLAEN
jgi:hypothetical protein